MNHTIYRFRSCMSDEAIFIISKQKSRKINFCAYRFPFNWKTPFGYAIALLSLCACSFASPFSGCGTVLFMIGSCWLTVTFIKDIKNDLSRLNANDMTSNTTYGQLKRQFRECIREFSTIKELSKLFFLLLTFFPS